MNALFCFVKAYCYLTDNFVSFICMQGGMQYTILGLDFTFSKSRFDPELDMVPFVTVLCLDAEIFNL